MNKKNLRWVFIGLFTPLLFSFDCSTGPPVPYEVDIYNAMRFEFVINNSTADDIKVAAETISFSGPVNEIGNRSAERTSYYYGYSEDYAYAEIDAGDTGNDEPQLALQWSGENFNEKALAYSFALTLSDSNKKIWYAGWENSYAYEQFGGYYYRRDDIANQFAGTAGHGYGYFTAENIGDENNPDYRFDRRTTLPGDPLDKVVVRYTVDITRDSSGTLQFGWDYEIPADDEQVDVKTTVVY